MAFTNFAALLDHEKKVWRRDLWRAARNRMFLNRFMGNDDNAMVQRITELTKTERGDLAVITLVADLEGDGRAGDNRLEDFEEAIKSYDQAIIIDQIRHANRSKGRMAEQRTIVRFRENSRNVLAYWLADRTDQMAFLTLSGVSFNFHTNMAPRIGSDMPNLAFANTVTAPTANRHRRWSASGGLMAGDTSAVTASDTPSWAMLVEAKAYAKDNFIKPLRGDGGTELYHVFMTPRGVAKLKLDPDFLAAWRHAQPRSSNNPLFKSTDVIYVDGLAIHEYRHVINTTGAASGSKWGAGGLVNGQRVLFCGAQSLAYADLGSPDWVEKKFDFDNQPAISTAKIMGFLKPVFRSHVSKTDEDFGMMVIDTAI